MFLEPEILLPFQTGFSLVKSAVVCAILERISGLEPSSVITEPRYLKRVTVSSSCPFTLFSVLIPLVLFVFSLVFSALISMHHHHHHQSLNREGRWGTTDDFATTFLHFSLFSTALWDLTDSRPVHFLMLFSNLCPPCLLPPFTVPCKMVLARADERET